jgi:hypothetical protein
MTAPIRAKLKTIIAIKARSRRPEQVRLIGRLWIIGGFLGNGNAFEQRMGLLSCQDRRLAFLDRLARAPDRIGRISLNNMAGHQAVE